MVALVVGAPHSTVELVSHRIVTILVTRSEARSSRPPAKVARSELLENK